MGTQEVIRRVPSRGSLQRFAGGEHSQKEGEISRIRNLFGRTVDIIGKIRNGVNPHDLRGFAVYNAGPICSFCLSADGTDGADDGRRNVLVVAGTGGIRIETTASLQGEQKEAILAMTRYENGRIKTMLSLGESLAMLGSYPREGELEKIFPSFEAQTIIEDLVRQTKGVIDRIGDAMIR